jgi:hypothetical protein
MFARLILSATLALGLGAAAQAKTAVPTCPPVVHHVVHRVVRHTVACHCVVYHRASFHRAHRHARMITRVKVVRRDVWIRPIPVYLRPSPLHPWDTNSDGYLTWSGKPAFATPGVAPVADRYAPGPPADCHCAPTPGYPQP